MTTKTGNEASDAWLTKKYKCFSLGPTAAGRAMINPKQTGAQS